MAVDTESTIKQLNIKHRNIHHAESERDLVRGRAWRTARTCPSPTLSPPR